MKIAKVFEACRTVYRRCPSVQEIEDSTLELAIQHVEENLRASAFLDRVSDRATIRQRSEVVLAIIRKEFRAWGQTIYVKKTDLTRRFCPNTGRSGALTVDDLYLKVIPHLQACGDALCVVRKGKHTAEVYAFRVEDGDWDDPDRGYDEPAKLAPDPSEGTFSTTSTNSTGGDITLGTGPSYAQHSISTNSTSSSLRKAPPETSSCLLRVSPPVETVESVEKDDSPGGLGPEGNGERAGYAWVSGNGEGAAISKVWPALVTAKGPLAADFETYGELKTKEALSAHLGEVRLLSVCVEGETPVLFDVKAIGYDGAKWAQLFEGRPVIMHNARFDASWLLVKFGIPLSNVFCTLTAAQILTNGDRTASNKLDAVLERYLGIPLSKDQQTSDWGSMFLTQEQLNYAASDVKHLHALKDKLAERLRAEGLVRTFEVEMALLPSVIAMQSAGMPLSSEKLQRVLEDVEKEKQRHLAELKHHLGPWINYNSPDQLKAAFRAVGVALENTEEDTLVECNHPAARALLDYRQKEAVCRQAKSLLPKVINDRIYSNFLPMGTRTGRFSSKGENLQNVSKGVMRTCFIPPSGDHTLVIADYGQIELRAAAHFSQDPAMLSAFREGRDLHAQTASIVLGKPLSEVTKPDRQIAKATNFGLLYGQREGGLVRSARSGYGVELSLEQAKALRDRFFDHYCGLAAWHARAWAWARGFEGSEARTIIGRRRWIPEEAEESRRVWKRFQAQTNNLVQGSCADGLKLSMSALFSRLPAGARMVSCVHDELIIETPRAVAQETLLVTKQVMQETFESLFEGLPVEAEAKICETWGDKN